MKVVAQFMAIMILVIYIYAVIGQRLYGKELRHGNPKLQGSDYLSLGYSSGGHTLALAPAETCVSAIARYVDMVHFRSFSAACLTLFHLLIVRLSVPNFSPFKSLLGSSTIGELPTRPWWLCPLDGAHSTSSPSTTSISSRS